MNDFYQNSFLYILHLKGNDGKFVGKSITDLKVRTEKRGGGGEKGGV